jgi:hypothetical protein
MFSRLTALCVSAALSACCIAQKADQWDSYQPRTLASVIKINKPLCEEMDSSPESQGKKKILLTGDNFPSKVTLTYEGKSRPLVGPLRDVLVAWAKSTGRSEDMTQVFATEGLFEENGAHFWIALQKPLVDPLAKEVKAGQHFNAYVMWMGSIKVEDHWEWLFAMNEYDAPTGDPKP